MIDKITKNQEFDHFSSIANEWWKPEGKFKILHQVIPLRIEYILHNIEKKKMSNLDILDLGCGGGLTCEPLARLKANVTGIDFVKKNIQIARNHAIESDLRINYIHDDIDTISIKKKYDLILMLEIIEHLDNWKSLIVKFKKNLKPKGIIILSTINRTRLSKIFAIFMAENIFKWIPKNTHNYDKLITPDELKIALRKNNFIIKNITGMNLHPITKQWILNESLFPINYFCTAKLN
jgi:2-polyprenyl-6-hydroxyphenyl methylase/3-demethylubiquinone-9 3-methyltransferase